MSLCLQKRKISANFAVEIVNKHAMTMKHLLTLLFIFPFVVLSSAAQNTTIGDDLSTASQVSQTPVSKNNGLQFYITSPTTCIVIENKEQFVSDDVIIPENAWIDGKSYTVTGIAREAFQYCSALTSLEIPASVKSIRDYAFLRCEIGRAHV